MELQPVRRESRVTEVLLALAIVVWTALWGWLNWSPSGISWHFFTDGAHALLVTSGLHVYADHPTLQIGPLTFVIAGSVGWLDSYTARVVAQLVMLAAGPLLVWWLAPLVVADRRLVRVTAATLVVVPAWSVLAVRWAHLDDVLAVVFTVAAIRAVCSGRAITSGLLLAAAVASKPWAVGFVPLLLVLQRHRVRSLITAGAAVAAVYAPFFIADSATINAFRPKVPVSSDSGLWFFGYRGHWVPAWGRTAQLIAAPFIALAAVLRQRWTGLFIVAFAIRLALDPQDLPYYIGAAAVAAAIFDLLGTRWTMPWTTIITVLVLWQPFVADFSHALDRTTGWSHWWYANQTIVGASHVLWALAVIVFVFAAPQRWLGLENPQLPRFTLSRRTKSTSTEPPSITVATD